MSHLSKCNVIESSEDEQRVKRLREKRQKLDKSINDEIRDREPKDGLEIYKGDLHLSDDDNTIKVFHFDLTYEKRNILDMVMGFEMLFCYIITFIYRRRRNGEKENMQWNRSDPI